MRWFRVYERVTLLCLPFTLFVLLLLLIRPAQAHELGGKVPRSGSMVKLGISRTGSYNDPIQLASSSWHTTPTWIYTYYQTCLVDGSNITFRDIYTSETWWALTNNNCSGWWCSITASDIYMNTRTLGSESDYTRQKVATHEIGHALGLAHTTDGGYAAIMKQGYLSYNTPQNHDINDINSMYP